MCMGTVDLLAEMQLLFLSGWGWDGLGSESDTTLTDLVVEPVGWQGYQLYLHRHLLAPELTGHTEDSQLREMRTRLVIGAGHVKAFWIYIHVCIL